VAREKEARGPTWFCGLRKNICGCAPTTNAHRSDYPNRTRRAREIIAVELPEVGETIESGAPFGELESVRTVQELVAPVSGVVTAVNADLDDHPVLVNEDPYHDGWLIEVKLTNESELEELLAAEDYEESLSAE